MRSCRLQMSELDVARLWRPDCGLQGSRQPKRGRFDKEILGPASCVDKKQFRRELDEKETLGPPICINKKQFRRELVVEKESVQKQFRREPVVEKETLGPPSIDEKQSKRDIVDKATLDSPNRIDKEQLQRDHVADKVASDPPKYINGILTDDVCQLIFHYLEDFRDIGRARATCRGFNEAGKNVASLRCVCRDIDHEIARKIKHPLKSLEELNGKMSESELGNNPRDTSQQPLDDIDDANDGRGQHSTLVNVENHVQNSSVEKRNGNEFRRCSNGDNGLKHGTLSQRTPEDNGRCTSQRTSEYMDVAHGGCNSSLGSVSNPVQESSTGKRNIDGSQRLLEDSVAHGIVIKQNTLKEKFHEGEACESSKTNQHTIMLFREVLEWVLSAKPRIQQLRVEIEPKLQSKSVTADERQMTDHWLSDPRHLKNWVPSVGLTLQHLCIVDYGQQAIMRQSPILTILSQHCKRLKTIDLRNMFIDTKGCTEFPELSSFTLRCVKMNSDALDDISAKMKGLQTLALLGVFGVMNGHLSSPQLKVLCLGLSTKAKSVTINLPNLTKLQLKMACPDKLSIIAPAVKFIAFNLEVGNCSAIEFREISKLQELLYGASNFLALSMLGRGNRLMNKVFLDIPCMALGEDGKWLGVLKDVTLNLPSFKTLQLECPNLEILNIGPGLWHSMECNKHLVMEVKEWPPVKTLILHMIPQTLEICVDLVNMFWKQLQVTLVNLEISVHTTSPVDSNVFFEAIKDQVVHLNFRPKLWTKSLDFSCFTF